jgi:dTDP-4-dehydrorhamnose reductase
MKILITGASGLLGSHLSVCLAGEHHVRGMDRNPWWGERPLELLQGDLRDTFWVAKAVEQYSPDILIHCAAMANVDMCEKDPTVAEECNVGMTRCLARAVPARCLFLYVSTDGIFRGKEPFAREDTPPAPLTVYGRTKWKGEREVESLAPSHIILRTNFYGWSSGRKPSAAEWLYNALERQAPITLFEDFFFTPIYVTHLADRIRILLQSPHRGVLNVCGSERISKSRFGELMAEMAGFSLKNTRKGSLKEARLAAPRPRDMSLDCGRFQQLTGVALPDCREGLRQFLLDRGVSLSERYSSLRGTDASTQGRALK